MPIHWVRAIVWNVPHGRKSDPLHQMADGLPLADGVSEGRPPNHGIIDAEVPVALSET